MNRIPKSIDNHISNNRFPFAGGVLANRIRACLILFSICIAQLAMNYSVAAQDHIPWQTDLQQAKQTAADQNKLILLHFTASWCSGCKEIERFVFVNPMAIRAISNRIVPMKVDVDLHKALAKEYGVTSVPFDIVITPAGHIVRKRVSPRSSDGYMQLIEQSITQGENVAAIRNNEQLRSTMAEQESQFQAAAESRAGQFGATKPQQINRSASQGMQDIHPGAKLPEIRGPEAWSAPESPEKERVVRTQNRLMEERASAFQPEFKGVEAPSYAAPKTPASPTTSMGGFAQANNTTVNPHFVGNGDNAGQRQANTNTNSNTKNLASGMLGGNSNSQPVETAQSLKVVNQFINEKRTNPDSISKTAASGFKPVATGTPAIENGTPLIENGTPLKNGLATSNGFRGGNGFQPAQMNSNNRLAAIEHSTENHSTMAETDSVPSSSSNRSLADAMLNGESVPTADELIAGVNRQTSKAVPDAASTGFKPATGFTPTASALKPTRQAALQSGPLTTGNGFSPTKSANQALTPRLHSTPVDSTPVALAAKNTSAPKKSMSETTEGTQAVSQKPEFRPELGLEGYCSVTLVEEQKWVKGSKEFGCIHRGRLYLFGSAEKRERFQMTPDMFSPLLGGADPVVFHTEGDLKTGARKHGVFYGDEGGPTVIVLFENQENRDRFEANPSEYMRSVRQAMSRLDSDRLLR